MKFQSFREATDCFLGCAVLSKDYKNYISIENYFGRIFIDLQSTNTNVE